MPDLRVRRTLVKSPPELWAELSEVESLARHLGEFGEIAITRVEPESKVAWEGATASGIVELEPTGWGTKVTITAEVPEEAEPEAQVEPEAQAGLESTVDSRQSTVDSAEPAAEPEPPAVQPEPAAVEPAPAAVEPMPAAEPEARKRGVFARWLFRDRRETAPPAPDNSLAGFPEPQMPAWRAQGDPEQGHELAEQAHELAADADADADADTPRDAPEPPRVELEDEFEFDFQVRRGHDEPAAAEDERGPDPIAPERAREVLEEALENLGQAHHRPFSRG